MLTIKPLASGSTGNCYTVSNGKATVMLDCGLPFPKLIKSMYFMFPDAVLVTHEHKDHALAAADLMRRGVDVYMTHGTADALGLSGHRLHRVNIGNLFVEGGINISVFRTQHDAQDPCGFLLDAGEDTLLYATDTYYIRYKFHGLTKIMIEANHSYEILRENVAAGRLDPVLAERLTKSHFSIENVIDFLKANDLSLVKEIWLIHLSRDNADPALFKKMVQDATGKPVYVAGMRGAVL